MGTKYLLYFLTGGVVVSIVTYFASHLPKQERHILFLTINEIFHMGSSGRSFKRCRRCDIIASWIY
jgi:hypothetical protein